MIERELHFKIFDESVTDLDNFKAKHGFKTDYEAIIAIIGMVIAMDKNDDYKFSFLQNGSVEISVKTPALTFVSKP